MFNKISPRQAFFTISRLIERGSSYAQGKGYGSATVTQEVKLVLQLLGKSPQLAIDIGGNVGAYTAELRSKAPEAEIHTFEPSATNIEKLKARFADDKRIKLLPYAVSNLSGTATLFANEPGSGLGSLTKRKLDHFDIDFNFKETIRTIKFADYWATELARRVIDIVKIDIEGHELSALGGFGDAIAATRVLQFEFGGCNIDTRTYFQDFWYFFKERGFAIFRITSFGLERIPSYRETDEHFSTTNYIALNTKNV